MRKPQQLTVNASKANQLNNFNTIIVRFAGHLFAHKIYTVLILLIIFMLHSNICPENNVMAMKEVLRERLSSSVDGEELTEALVLIRTRAPDLESVRKLNCW